MGHESPLYVFSNRIADLEVVLKIAVLWTHLSGYMNACLQALEKTPSVELFVANIRSSPEAPFHESMFSWIKNRYEWENYVDSAKLVEQLQEFDPDVILCGNWHINGYRKSLKALKHKTVRIFASDRPWLGTPRQWLGKFSSRFYLHPMCEGMFVAGERQVVFAKKMGFSEEEIIRGLYSCDQEMFSQIFPARKLLTTEEPSFAFVGRFSPEKGLDVLVAAYRRYRLEVDEPWPLSCYGTGPLQHLLEGISGIECMGFCQPEDLPQALKRHSCLILPSKFEPWGLVVQEAAATGMAVIVSDAVGASVHLVQDGYNGYVAESGNEHALVKAMLRYTRLSQSDRRAMGENSHRMSLQFTPERWAKTLFTRSSELIDKKNAVGSQVFKNES